MVTSNPNSPLKIGEVVSRSCFNCHSVLEAEIRKPIKINLAIIIPRLEGPWICEECRTTKGVLKKARKLMELKLGMLFPLPKSFIEDTSINAHN